MKRLLTNSPQHPTGELTAQGLRDMLECWGLKEENLTCLTPDNGANMLKV